MKIALLNKIRKGAGNCMEGRILTSASAARSASWQEAYSMNAKTLVAPSAVEMVRIERIKTGEQCGNELTEVLADDVHLYDAAKLAKHLLQFGTCDSFW
jgi:hypothetical protein